MSLQKVLPVIASIIIILFVAVLRERSRTLSAILATMPINMTLGLWVVGSLPDITQPATENFVRSLIVGLVPAFLWLIVVYIAVRAGWTLLTAVLAGYGVWGTAIAITFALGILNVNR